MKKIQLKIKICGVNDARFAVQAETLGANYLGFIFAPESPRRVTTDIVREAVRMLHGTARRVGVFTHAALPEIRATMRACALEIVQLHRRATAEDVAALKAEGFEVWTLAGGAPGNAVIFDASHGDGETELRPGPYKTVLAGGISADNLAAACARGADILDVSGALETRPGVKSVAKLQHFFNVFHSIQTQGAH